jgi:hypothetical protein
MSRLVKPAWGGAVAAGERVDTGELGQHLGAEEQREYAEVGPQSGG